MWVGIGVGIGRNRFATGIFNAYALRVTADGGITEAGQCVDAVTGLLLNASLLLIPSGYKGGKLYAEIPTNGTGDLTWTRASDAWRTNADGLIQRVPWNLVTNSENIGASNWQNFDSTESLNVAATLDPIGQNGADKLQETTANALHVIAFQTGLMSTSNTYTFSGYLKAAERTWAVVYLYNGTTSYFAYFNLSTGVKGSVASGATSAIEAVGNGWYRCSVTLSVTGASNANGGFITATGDGTASFAGTTGSGIYIWGAQLVEGTTAQTYLPTTDRLNFPRLSYMYGSCPALLLEPQRTNLAQNSGFVGTGSAPTNWAQPGGTGTSSLTSSTLGVGVQACSQSATAQRPFLQQDFAVSANTTYTFSMYVESISGTINYNNIMFITNPPSGATTSYFLNDVAINEVTQATTGRLSIRLVVGATTGTISMRCGLGVGSSATGSILFSRPQFEVGAYTTTSIITGVGATATRVADSFSRNNIYTNGLITSSGGTWFVELRGNVAYVRDSGMRLGIGDTTALTSNSFWLSPPTTSGRLAIVKSIAGVNTTLYTTTTDTTKIAIKWNGTTADVFVNGTKVVSGTAFTTTIMENLITNGIGVPFFIQQMALYTEPKSDQFCIDLTTI